MYSEINLDLQAYAKRTYDSILYQSTFYNFLNANYIGVLRQTGAPVVEVAKTNPLSVTKRSTVEIQSDLSIGLATYSRSVVDLTELKMNYAVRVPVAVSGADISNAIQDAADLEDSAIAEAIDEYGYGKLAAATMDEFEWNFSTKDQYVSALNQLRAKLFNKKITGEYRLGLGATEYANLVSALTSILKFETLAGVEGVDRGVVANAYGVEIFPINDNVLDGVIGYFFNPIAVVGDSFFDSFAQYPGNYPGFPGLKMIKNFFKNLFSRKCLN